MFKQNKNAEAVYKRGAFKFSEKKNDIHKKNINTTNNI